MLGHRTFGTVTEHSSAVFDAGGGMFPRITIRNVRLEVCPWELWEDAKGRNLMRHHDHTPAKSS